MDQCFVLQVFCNKNIPLGLYFCFAQINPIVSSDHHDILTLINIDCMHSTPVKFDHAQNGQPLSVLKRGFVFKLSFVRSEMLRWQNLH